MFVIIAVSADGLASSGARTSRNINYRVWMYMYKTYIHRGNKTGQLVSMDHTKALCEVQYDGEIVTQSHHQNTYCFLKECTFALQHLSSSSYFQCVTYGTRTPFWKCLVRTLLSYHNYCQTFNISCSLVGVKLLDHSDVVGTSPVGTAPTTSSFST